MTNVFFAAFQTSNLYQNRTPDQIISKERFERDLKLDFEFNKQLIKDKTTLF